MNKRNLNVQIVTSSKFAFCVLQLSRFQALKATELHYVRYMLVTRVINASAFGFGMTSRPLTLEHLSVLSVSLLRRALCCLERPLPRAALTLEHVAVHRSLLQALGSASLRTGTILASDCRLHCWYIILLRQFSCIALLHHLAKGHLPTFFHHGLMAVVVPHYYTYFQNRSCIPLHCSISHGAQWMVLHVAYVLLYTCRDMDIAFSSPACPL